MLYSDNSKYNHSHSLDTQPYYYPVYYIPAVIMMPSKSLLQLGLPINILTAVKFPDIYRFSRQVVTLQLTFCCKEMRRNAKKAAVLATTAASVHATVYSHHIT